MHIGLIGGIGPAATDYYYRNLIKAFEGRGDELELTIVHADSPTLVRNLGAGDTAAQAAIFERCAQRLKGAGAEAVAVTSIAGHFCSEAFGALSPLPVLDLLESVAAKVEGRGRLGILGTKTVMGSGMYGRLPVPEVLAPSGAALEAVHRNYVEMATIGAVTEAQRQVFFEAGRALCRDRGAEAVLLGGTDLFLAFEGQDCGFPVIDCARFHIEDLAEAAGR